jgi:hypothetical protein
MRTPCRTIPPREPVYEKPFYLFTFLHIFVGPFFENLSEDLHGSRRPGLRGRVFIKNRTRTRGGIGQDFYSDRPQGLAGGFPPFLNMRREWARPDKERIFFRLVFLKFYNSIILNSPVFVFCYRCFTGAIKKGNAADSTL